MKKILVFTGSRADYSLLRNLVKRISNKKVRVTWESYFVSEIKKKEFSEFYNFLSQFYTNSLKNLKLDLE